MLPPRCSWRYRSEWVAKQATADRKRDVVRFHAEVQRACAVGPSFCSDVAPFPGYSQRATLMEVTSASWVEIFMEETFLAMTSADGVRPLGSVAMRVRVLLVNGMRRYYTRLQTTLRMCNSQSTGYVH